MDILALQRHFHQLTDHAFEALGPHEALSCDLAAEDTHFVRINGARVRQAGHVHDVAMTLRLFVRSDDGLRTASGALSLRGDDTDADNVRKALTRLQQDVPLLPRDPYAVPPAHHGSLEQTQHGTLADPTAFHEEVMPLLQGVDVAGIYASGPMVRATANSAGQRQWFSTESFSFDYSLYTPSEKAVKRTLSGTQWDARTLAEEVGQARGLLAALERPAVRLARGEHRAYLAPASVAELVGILSWGALGERSIRKGESPLRTLRSGERALSPLFSLDEDFTTGLVPRFTGEGHVAPERVPIIAHGKLVSSLVHERTAREHGIPSNGAAMHEGQRAARMTPGTLQHQDILSTLGTGVFLSNLHYLNWSNLFEGRITGMTRYACLWVKDGEAVGPIETMRWDDSLFRLFGSELLAVDDRAVLVPEVGTYGNRQPGGMYMPGMLVERMQFTL